MDDMTTLPADIAKAMPARGPLQQYRLVAAAAFTCVRCGNAKTSKLVTVVDKNDANLLCNGCYGRLLSLWQVKAGTEPDAERDAAIVVLLAASVTPDQIAAAQQRLATNAAHRLLSPAAQQMLATTEAVRATLVNMTGLDWSAAVIGLCKAVEVEIVRRIAEPLRDATKQADLAGDLADKDFARFARYCAGRAPAPEMGSLAYMLGVAARSKRRATHSPMLTALTRLGTGWTGGEWILAADGLAEQANALTRQFRNPAAHTAVLDKDDFDRCRDLVQGENGLLGRLIEATLPRR